jgi:hypothetical protein
LIGCKINSHCFAFGQLLINVESVDLEAMSPINRCDDQPDVITLL